MDEARRNKIENIKKALADGTYHVSAAEVARKILDNMQEPQRASGCHPAYSSHE
jgi:anti-sigma28 factor (negative regulator of flagellin synthesis)